jgi:ubiquinone/menaquinone biosynthesis C-methylase UbiE
MNRKQHWEAIFGTKQSTQVSWYKPHLDTSLQMIERTAAGKSAKTARVIDVGGGASTLVDDLLAKGFEHITVLDISSAALKVTQERLGPRADNVTWLESDITRVVLPPEHFDIWHDRAVFHFLTDPEDRRKYIAIMKAALKFGGYAVVATFAPDGPQQCSGLDTVRYSPESLQATFGVGCSLIESIPELHETPFGTRQSFVYCSFEKSVQESTWAARTSAS